MDFIRYPHLEKFGNTEVENIEFGITYIFPKLDGTNASVWCSEWTLEEGACVLSTGSRNRELSENKDNHGFNFNIQKDQKLWNFFENIHHLNFILYGEWLVPHTVKHYREEAWRRFWIFDVYNRETGKFLPYEIYQPMLEAAGLDYIPCIKKIKNGSWENFLHEAKNCRFMLPDDDLRPGEGIVIKNYEWTNKFQKVTWAKIVNGEFKDAFVANLGANLLENVSNAQKVCDMACTASLIEKEYAKLCADDGSFSRHYIPRLLHTVFYSVVKEELWDCLKKINYGLLNFKELQQLCILKVKATKPDLF